MSKTFPRISVRPEGNVVVRSRALVMGLAEKFAKCVGGREPEYIGEHRYSDHNDSARVVTFSPLYGVRVVCVVSIFDDGSAAVDYFSDEDTSESNRFENIVHTSYFPDRRRRWSREAHLPDTMLDQMENDLKWVWSEVDGYYESWHEDRGDD